MLPLRCWPDAGKTAITEIQHGGSLAWCAVPTGLLDESGAPKQPLLRIPPPPSLPSGLGSKHSGGLSSRPSGGVASSKSSEEKSRKRPAPSAAVADTPKKQTLITPRSNVAVGTAEVLQRVRVMPDLTGVGSALQVAALFAWVALLVIQKK